MKNSLYKLFLFNYQTEYSIYLRFHFKMKSKNEFLDFILDLILKLNFKYK